MLYRLRDDLSPTSDARLPPLCTFEQHASNDSSRDRDTTQDGNPHQAFFGNLIIDQAPQASCLQVGRLVIE